MEPLWLTEEERAAWLRLVAVVELLPGVLDAQLRADSELTHFEYFVLAMLSEAPERTLRMTTLAQRTNATLPRLSHVVNRLERRGLVERFPCPEDGRATNTRLTSAGWITVVAAAPFTTGATVTGAGGASCSWPRAAPAAREDAASAAIATHHATERFLEDIRHLPRARAPPPAPRILPPPARRGAGAPAGARA